MRSLISFRTKRRAFFGITGEEEDLSSLKRHVALAQSLLQVPSVAGGAVGSLVGAALGVSVGHAASLHTRSCSAGHSWHTRAPTESPEKRSDLIPIDSPEPRASLSRSTSLIVCICACAKLRTTLLILRFSVAVSASARKMRPIT